MIRRLVILSLLMAVLTGCSYRDLDDFSFSDINPFAKDEELLPGERHEILTQTDALSGGSEGAGPPSIPPATANADWSQPGGNAANAPGHLALDTSLGRAWSASAGRGSSDDSRLTVSPIIYGGVVYTMDAEATVSAHGGGGGYSWRVSLKPEYEDDDGVIGGGIAADGGRIYAATGYGDVYALSPQGGQQLWVAKLKVPVRSAPTAADGKVFVVTADNQLHALSQENGAELWTYRGIPETTGLIANASPAATGDTVVVPYSSGEVVAFNVETGEPKWADTLTRTQLFTSVSGLTDVAGRPVIDRDRVYAVSVSGRMVAVDLDNGTRLWTRNVASVQTPYAAGDTVYVVSMDGQLAALSREDGKARWVTKLPTKRNGNWNGPVLAGGLLWLSSADEKLVAVDAASGQIASQTDIGEPSYIQPVVAGGALYLLLDNGTLAAFN